MAQQNTSSTDNKPISDKSKQQRSNPLELRTSMPHQHCPPTEPFHNTCHLSQAELYISQQSQMEFDPNDSQLGTSSISGSASSIRHAEKMHEWHEKQVNDVYKQEPHRYKYGTPPSTANHSTFRGIDTQTDSHSIQTSSYPNRKMKK